MHKKRVLCRLDRVEAWLQRENDRRIGVPKGETMSKWKATPAPADMAAASYHNQRNQALDLLERVMGGPARPANQDLRYDIEAMLAPLRVEPEPELTMRQRMLEVLFPNGKPCASPEVSDAILTLAREFDKRLDKLEDRA